MATLDAAALELADSMPIESVPAKLRCGECNKLCVNAVKLPCCDQNICGPCAEEIPETCPICSHSPLSADDSKPNKSLRMTVKAFIKNEEKRRAKEAESQAPQPSDSATPVLEEASSVVVNEADTPVERQGSLNEPDGVPLASTNELDGIGHSVDSESADASRDVQFAATGGHADFDEEEEDDDDDVVITTERPETDEMQTDTKQDEEEQYNQNNQMQEDDQQMNGQQGFGFDQNQNQNFSNMDFNNMNNFNQMMAGMQNGMGMPNFGMGMPNMMGMAGMNMDPSMMFNGGFGGGMGGMNDMSGMMGMGMGMSGMGNFGGMSGMGMGGGPGFFQPNGGGYNQQNFGNHMNPNFHHNRGYGNRPYNRGFGRGGRGSYGHGHGRGRGGWQNYGQYSHGQNQNQHNFMNQHHQQQQQNFRGNDENMDSSAEQAAATRGSPSYEPMNSRDGSVNARSQHEHAADSQHPDDTNRGEANATNYSGDATADFQNDERMEHTAQPQDEEGPEDIARGSDFGNNSGEHATTGAGLDYPDDNLSTTEAGGMDRPASRSMSHDFNNHDPHYQQGYGYGGRGGRGGFRGGRGGFRGQSGAYGHVSTLTEREPAPAPAPPINAPTGPKAMRAGLPNSGWYSRPQQPAAPAQSEYDRSRDVEDDRRSRTRSRTPSRSRDEDGYERRRASDVREESEESYERRKERERRKRKERDGRYDSREEDFDDEPRKKTRSRSESRDEGRSKHRSRDKEEEHHSRSRRDRSHDRRKHRHRSRSPAKDNDVNGDGYESSRRKHKSERRREEEYDESDRGKERSHRRSSRRDDDYDKDRSNESSRHRHRSSRTERDRDDNREVHRSVAVVEEPEEEFEFKIKGKSMSMKQGQTFDGSMGPPPTAPARDRSERRSSGYGSTPVATPTTPFIDPYEAERASHRKKREAEQQKKLEDRRQSNSGLGKHGRDDEEFDAPTGPRADAGRGGKRMVRKDLRRHSFKYEGEV